MRVLVVGTSGGGVERAAAVLTAAGHCVLRCHGDGDPPFPCNALVEGRGCPLDAGPVDVVLDLHTRPGRIPSHYEDGVVCGLRRGVPLVVAGAPVHPYWKWAALELGSDDDLVAACESAASVSVEQHAEVDAATEAASAALERAGIDARGTAATVHRRGPRVHVVLELPPRPPGVHATIVADVIAAVRALDSSVETVDVAIV